MSAPGSQVMPQEPTVSVGKGPYYVSNTPELPAGDLNYTGLPGDPVRITGRVYGGPDGWLPLPGAKIEIWHADSAGSYHPNAPGDAAALRPEDLALRGYVLTAPDGTYEFHSIYPGKYPGRCRHYHIRISATGHRPVSTQLIFPPRPGDTDRPENDFVARLLPDDYQLQLTLMDDTLTAEFDFCLAADQ